MPVDVVELAQRLVAIPSDSGRSNAPAVDALADALDALDFSVVRYEQRVTDPGTGPQFNVVAEEGRGPRRLIFSGHIDTVPVGDEALWQHDPYGGDGIVDGRLYGRGSVDMKGQIAAMVAAVASAGDALDRLTLVLAISGSEEVGHLGIKSLAAAHTFEDAVGAVIGEPTGLAVYHAHKGAVTLRVDVHGVSCHSSQPHLGVNAIEQATRFMAALDRELADWRALRHSAFDDEPPTCTVSRIAGGIADNVVPDRCWLHVNARGLVAEHLDLFRDRVRRTMERLTREDAAQGVPEARRFRAEDQVLRIAPPMLCGTDTPWYRLVADVVGQAEPQFARYGTDGGVLSSVGLPCVVWGPGDIARAHSIDEYIAVEELRHAVVRYAALIRAVAAAELPTITTRRWTEPIRPT